MSETNTPKKKKPEIVRVALKSKNKTQLYVIYKKFTLNKRPG
jgi:hypothetical protein